MGGAHKESLMNNPFGTQTMFNAREVFSGGKSKSTSMVKGYEQPSAYTPALNKNFIFPIWAKDINLWMTHMDCPLYIAGPTGAGKTAAVKYIAALLNYPVLEVTGHSRLEFPELVGHYTVVNGSMQWVDGPLTMAMKYGGMFLLNEIDLLDPSTAAGLNSILDGSPLVIPELGGLAVYPDPYFRFIATGNSNGAGDTTGRYQGVLTQNMAFLDRFMLIVADYLPREMEIKALAKAEPSLPEELLSQLVFFANDVRRMFIGAGDTGESCEVTMSTRTLLRTAELIRLYSPMKAYGVDVVVEALNRALLFKASPATRNTLLELLQRIRGESH